MRRFKINDLSLACRQAGFKIFLVLLFFIIYNSSLITPILSSVLDKVGIHPAYAQDLSSLSIANSVSISDSQVLDGDIVSAGQSGYFLTKIPYDMAMVGVVSEKPAISIIQDTSDKTYPIVSSGIAYVNVNGSNGSIKKGDLVTASTTAGSGMKANQTGFIIGSALEDFNGSTSAQKGRIQVALNFRYAVSAEAKALVFKNIRDVLSLSTVAALERPSEIFKYTIAGLSVLVTVILAVFTFGRNAALGIEALGRNPRASRNIILGVIINVLTSVSIIAAGVGAAYFIIILP